MSTMITLKQFMARRTRVALSLGQHSLMIAGFLLALGIFNVLPKGMPSQGNLISALSGLVESVESVPVFEEESPPSATLSPRMQGALDYVTRRYRVSPDVLVPVFEVAQLIGKERRIDPLLIVAVIGVESRFNPFAESAMGAQGLMQVIPRFHQDKVPEGVSSNSLFDPITNVKVGVRVLEEAIRRRGNVIAGLQYYAGSSESDGSYASKVLAEKARLEQAARRLSDFSA